MTRTDLDRLRNLYALAIADDAPPATLRAILAFILDAERQVAVAERARRPAHDRFDAAVTP